ncbi:unnamed protein product [Paramecium sonneborni]|uniref:Rab-GAP TBC domain-containing protein n=1 Tax=Paramecium sonneborni TaxID=65129 RepID=A0A8S1LHD4_9CILI|nr:unnamed protein product [Paramecium sonneborni]
MKQSTVRQRKGSFDSQLSASMFKSSVILEDKKKQIDDEIINYQNEDEFEMIGKKQLKNVPITLFNNDQLHKLTKKQQLSDDQKLQLAATLIQQRGIPYLSRKAIWMTFIEKGDAKKYFSKKPPQNIEEQIIKDVPRTGNDDKMNNKKYTNLLFRILCAYSIYNPKIGYTQGMNIICGKIILLLSIDGNDKQLELDNFEVIEDEEEIFWMFVHIMKSMEDLFIQGVPGIHKRILQLEQIIQNRCNEILVHLQCNNLENLCQCFSQYYFTMLMQNQEKKFARLILEMFLLFGDAFIQNFIVGTLEFYSLRITRMNELEKLMPFFRDIMFTSYYQELKKLKKQNLIIQHFQQNHYFDKQPYFGQPQNMPIVQVEEKMQKKFNPKNILNLLQRKFFGKILGQ